MRRIPFERIAQLLFDEPTVIKGMAEVLQAVLQARSARWTEIAAKMKGSEAAAYKRLQRLMKRADPREALLRLFVEQSDFVLGDPTEIERQQAKKTKYVGELKGKRRGFWVLVLATPFRGRAIPFHFVTYSSATINREATSRNQYHFKAFARVKALIGERPLVLDREFSYLELFKSLVVERIYFPSISSIYRLEGVSSSSSIPASSFSSTKKVKLSQAKWRQLPAATYPLFQAIVLPPA